jgi:signal transduction histidine kinase
VLTVAVLILLPTLALMQHRWIEQVSNAQREQMEHDLRTAAGQFRDAFVTELTRPLMAVRATVRSSGWDDRIGTWSDINQYPEVLGDVFLVDHSGGDLRLRRWHPDTRAFHPSAWPASLVAWRPRFAHAIAEGTDSLPIARPIGAEDSSLVVAPVLGNAIGLPRQRGIAAVLGFAIVQLDVEYLQGHLLPMLVERHLTSTAGKPYQVTIATEDDPINVLYQSQPGTALDLEGVVEGDLLRDTVRDPLVLLPRWTLRVQHGPGSVETAVAGLWRRNVAISLGILTLLSASIVLLVVSSRRVQRLARRELEFVAGVSHELRTPVAVIRSAAENLSHGVIDTSEKVKLYGQMIEAEARRLGDMVECALQYARLGSSRGLLKRVPLAPADIIEAAVRSASPALEGSTVHRSIATDLPFVLGDPASLQSAVQNLIINALKYGGPNAWVGIRAERSSEHQPEIRITIEDRGPGIAAEDLPHIFDPFYRGADALVRRPHGSGLGLSFVQHVVAAHKGRVTVTTRQGSGTAFTIHLPAVDAHESLDAGAVALAVTSSRR